MWPFNRSNVRKELEETQKQLEELRNVIADPNSWLNKIYNGSSTMSGTYVNENAALGISAVYSCVRFISWTIASLPLHVYKRLQLKGKEKAYDHPVYTLLHDSPNPEQSSFEFRAYMATQQLLWGAGVAEIERDRSGKPVALWPIPTYCVTPQRTPGAKLLVYEVNAGGTIYKPRQKITGASEYLWPDDTLVFPALTSTRDQWLSPITAHRETLGYSLALKEFGCKTFGQGVNPAGIVSVDTPLGETAEKDLLAALKGYSGLAQSNRIMYLNAGVTFERVGLPPQDAQFIENQRFNIAEIARIYNIPLFLLNETEKSTTWGSGLEEINAAFVAYTLAPYLVQREQEYTRKLFGSAIEGVRRDYFPEFCVEGLLRGKLLDRYQAYAIGRQHTFLSPDDIREKENMNPLPNGEGERYDTPLNMVNVDIADKIAKAGAEAKNNPQQQGGKKLSGSGKENDNAGKQQ